MNWLLRRIRQRGLFLLLEGHTDLLEVWIGLAFVVRGGWMIYYAGAIPPDVQGLIFPLGLNELHWGAMLMAVGTTQVVTGLVVAGHEVPRFRGILCTAAAIMQTYALMGYWLFDIWYRGAVPFIVVLVLGEMYLATRAWTDATTRTRRG